MIKYLIISIVVLIIFVNYCVLKVASNASKIEEKLENRKIEDYRNL